jgi:hypothetical protein
VLSAAIRVAPCAVVFLKSDRLRASGLTEEPDDTNCLFGVLTGVSAAIPRQLRFHRTRGDTDLELALASELALGLASALELGLGSASELALASESALELALELASDLALALELVLALTATAVLDRDDCQALDRPE